LKTIDFEANYLPSPLHLKWKVNEKIEKYLKEAEKEGEELYSKVDVRVLRFSDYGSLYVQSLQVPTDTWAQLAIQLTYYRIHHHLTAIYETGSTRAFYHGRTDTVRSCTEGVGKFIKAFDDPSVSAHQKFLFFREAVASHREYLLASVRGQAIDRYFLGLRVLASSMGVKVPFFESQAFKQTQNWRLSTSNMNPSEFWYPGFGAVVEDGYGVCYCIRNDNFKFSISNFVKGDTKGTNSLQFRQVLTKTLYDMRDLVTSLQKDSKL